MERPEAQAVDLLEDLDFFLRNQHHPPGKTPSAEVCSDCASSNSQLLCASSSGHIGCVEAALTDNPSVSSCRTPQGATPAHIAAKRGDSDILIKLTEADPTCVSSQDTRGTTPTHVSAYNGKYSCLRALVQRGGLANEKAHDGATPIHLAAANGHMDCLEYLVADAGGTVNNRTNSGATPGLFVFVPSARDCFAITHHVLCHPPVFLQFTSQHKKAILIVCNGLYRLLKPILTFRLLTA